MSDTPKKTFGKYEGISVLGAGAMGVVWRAQDPVLGRTVAIKTISAALGSDSENKERFLREARAAAQLNHPNIITVFDFGEADNELYMAMELLEGKDLKDLIAAGALTFDGKLDIMEQVADGLAYAHGRDVIHRDLKPGNIHVQPNGQVKILDFGLARLGSSELTKTGVVMGTPNYMSPEQVMGERVDARSDVFSAGAVFYELLTNRKPFDAESVHATLYQVVHRDPPPPRQWDPKLPDAVVLIVETAMIKSVEGRYKNAGALRDAVREFRYGEQPEVVEVEAAPGPGYDASSDRTSVTPSPHVPSIPGTPKPGSFRSYGRTGAVSLPPAAPAPSERYASGRVSRPGSKPPMARPAARVERSRPSASIPPPQKSTSPVLILVALVLLVLVGLVGYRVLNRESGDGSSQSSIDALTANLVETQLDLARRVLDDKDYKRAIEQTARTLKLDPSNPEALAIREQAQSAMSEIEASVTAARDAVTRGDSAQATAALERVMARDPKNPIVAELSSQLNANFSARAAAARTEMDQARTLATGKPGAAQDTAFSEGERLATTAAESLKGRQFTTATQTFLQARDAFDRARRAIETREKESVRVARPAAPTPASRPSTPFLAPTPAPTLVTSASTPFPTASALPTVVLRRIQPEIVVQAPTPAPTVPTFRPPPFSTPNPPPPPVPAPSLVGPSSESREFVTGATLITPAPASGGKQPKGFDMSGSALQEFTGRFNFEVLPTPLIPGAPFRVRIFLRNEGQNAARIATLNVKVLRNGEVTSPDPRRLEDDVKVGQRPLVAEVLGTWGAGTGVWVMDVEAVSRKGERFRCSLTMK